MIANTIFRGQRRNWELLPKIGRLKVPNLRDYEYQLMEDFKREALPYIDWPFDYNSPWDWLALAQHHGLPTRLLDWTSNPLAGLWFAVRNTPDKLRCPAVVWVFNPREEDILGGHLKTGHTGSLQNRP
jgi:hypothetical protein